VGLRDFLFQNWHDIVTLTLQHVVLVAVGTGLAVIAGIPVGILLTRRPGLSRPVLAIANVLQTIPSLALFGFLIPILGTYGIGRVPAIIALFLYSLLPIIRNTYTGIRGVDAGIREAARGMGMTDWQLLTKIELPLSLSVIIAGLRVATVISVGTATIAAAIGAGGLGVFIFRGLRMNDNQLILAGAIPAALMALAADFMLGWAEKRLSPEGKHKKAGIKGRVLAVATGAVVILALLVIAGGHRTNKSRHIAIGSKDFTEQIILGELLAQALEDKAGFQVERKFELGGDLCHRALLSGEIDAYVEYTGTAYTAILKHDPVSDAGQVYDQVKSDYESRFNLEWLQPLGFNNTFAILVRGEDAQRLNLKTISDAARFTGDWRAAFGQDFMSRQDGYPGFARTYGLKFAAPPSEMDLSLTYRALAGGQVDLIAGNSTDGLIDKLGLYQLEDDKHYFPPYEAAPVVRQDLLQRYPDAGDAINSLAGKITNEQMRRLNYAVDGDHRQARDVVREFLAGLH
jgi:osmoprotectant transport system permease protein